MALTIGIMQVNFQVNKKNYGFRAGPGRQIIFVENLSRGEYQRVSSYTVRENSQEEVGLDATKWIAAECELEAMERVQLYRVVHEYLNPFYMVPNKREIS